jgi:hypothetical protein
VAGQHEPRESDQDQHNDCDHDLQVRDAGFCFLFRPVPWFQRHSAGFHHTAAPALVYTNLRSGFYIPAADTGAGMAGWQPAVRAEYSATVLAGEGKDALIAAVVAACHRMCFGRADSNNSVPSDIPADTRNGYQTSRYLDNIGSYP